MKKILVAAGGTGGHLFPALAVVETLKSKLKDEVNFIFFGCPDKIEGRIVPLLGYEFYETNLCGVSKLLSLDGLKLLFKIIKEIIRLKSFIKKQNIDAVLCAGAYLSIPVGIASKLLNRKLFLMESNVNIGKANKFLACSADIIFTSFEQTKNYLSKNIQKKIILSGNPIRNSILKAKTREEAFKKFELKDDKPVVLIFGGSLGAQSINNAVIDNLNNFSNKEYQILWQCGNANKLSVLLPENVKLVNFIDDMGDAYAIADLVVSRAGATSVAEICTVGKPSILIPLPSASNNEQYLNAKEMNAKGASIIIENSVISEKLFLLIDQLINDKSMLITMSNNAALLGHTNASEVISNEIINVLI